MKLFFVLLLPSGGNMASLEDSGRVSLPRKDCFFGFHTDLHPTAEDTELGRDVDEAMVERFVREVRPDYVQHDCKGHYGYAGYFTKVGTPSPAIRQESLSIWRKVTRALGVGLYVHYSGVWDGAALQKNPGWAAIQADGTPEKWAVSTFSAYVDQLLIPQLKEAVTRFDLDGAWIDGDCWAVTLDYGKAALEAFKTETGISAPPRSSADPGWKAFREFHRENFRRYVKRYVDALHAFKPGFQITSNWMYSTRMPEEVKVPVDFLSGDYSPGDSVNTARMEARYLASTGAPWDLMAWGYNRGENQKNWSWKPALQLEQEAAVTVAQGGGWQVVYQSTRAGRIDGWMVDTLAEVGRFLRPRQAVCHKSSTVPQVALLLSRSSTYDSSVSLFPGDPTRTPLHGPLHALLELHYSVDVLAEHQLMSRMSEYPCVVIPDWHFLEDDLVAALKRYVQQGGSLLLTGPRAASLFRKELGVDFVGGMDDMDAHYAALEKQLPNAFMIYLHPAFREVNVEADGMLADCGGLVQVVNPAAATPLSSWYPTKDTTKDPMVASTVAGFGKGKIGAFYVSIGDSFNRSHAPVLRKSIQKMMRALFPHPMVEISGPPCIDVTLREKDGATVVHLVNNSNMQVGTRYPIVDYIAPVHGLTVRVRLPARPRAAEWAFGGRSVSSRFEENVLEVYLDALNIHDALVIEK
jgi:hypothetical protein